MILIFIVTTYVRIQVSRLLLLGGNQSANNRAGTLKVVAGLDIYLLASANGLAGVGAAVEDALAVALDCQLVSLAHKSPGSLSSALRARRSSNIADKQSSVAFGKQLSRIVVESGRDDVDKAARGGHLKVGKSLGKTVHNLVPSNLERLRLVGSRKKQTESVANRRGDRAPTVKRRGGSQSQG